MTNFVSDSTQPAHRGVEIFPQPLEIIFRFNASVIGAFQSATASWMQRRQEAAKDAVESIGKLAHCRDMGEAAAIQREWIKRSMLRLDEDFRPLASQASDRVPEAAPAGVNAVARTSEAPRLPTDEIENHAQVAKHSPHKKRAAKEEAPAHHTKSTRSFHGRRR